MHKVLLRVVKCKNNKALYKQGELDDDFAIGCFSTGNWKRAKKLISVVLNGQTFTNVQAHKRKHSMYIECIRDENCDVVAVL